MARIEELPDDFDESLNLNEAPSAHNVSLDEMYERRIENPDGISTKSFEEIMYDMSKTPLFMDSLDVANDQNGQNDMLEAIKALQYEGTKAEVALGFKDRGNEMVQQKQWRDAKEFYSKGLAVLKDMSEDKHVEPSDSEEELHRRRTLQEQLYVNRALCNLELHNFRSTTLDCAEALQLQPLNVKAHYRSASALFALDKLHEALDVSYRGLKIDPSNTALKKLLEKLQARSIAKEQDDRRRRSEERQKARERVMLATALKVRQIRIRGSERPPDLEEVAIRLSPDPLSPTSLLEFPVMFLYPMHNQSDFIKAFAEKDAIVDHLSYILPLPWDDKGEYTLKMVECFMDTITGGLMKIGKKLSLLETLSGSKTEIVDGLVRIYVVPSALSPKWIAEVKQKKGN